MVKNESSRSSSDDENEWTNDESLLEETQQAALELALRLSGVSRPASHTEDDAKDDTRLVKDFTDTKIDKSRDDGQQTTASPFSRSPSLGLKAKQIDSPSDPTENRSETGENDADVQHRPSSRNSTDATFAATTPSPAVRSFTRYRRRPRRPSPSTAESSFQTPRKNTRQGQAEAANDDDDLLSILDEIAKRYRRTFARQTSNETNNATNGIDHGGTHQHDSIIGAAGVLVPPTSATIATAEEPTTTKLGAAPLERFEPIPITTANFITGRRQEESARNSNYQIAASRTSPSSDSTDHPAVRPGAVRVRGMDAATISSSTVFTPTPSQPSSSSRLVLPLEEPIVSARIVTDDGAMDAEERQRIWEEAERRAERNVREAVWSEAVVASETQVIQEYRLKFSRKCALLFAIIVVAVGILGVLVGSSLQNHSEPITTAETEGPMSIAPSISSAPTAAPTVSNDFCTRALALPVDGSVQLFSTAQASPAPSIPNHCGSIIVQNGEPGVWFYVIGSGATFTASTCHNETHFDTQILVLNGRCDNFVCINGNDQYCGDQSQVEWYGAPDQMYYLYVFGYGSANGTFALSVNATDIAVADHCTDISDSTELRLGTPMYLSTTNATFDNAGECFSSDNTGPGVWFRMTAYNNALITVTTCDFVENQGGLDTQLTVFSGSCDDLICVAGNDDFCGMGSLVTFYAVAGTSYFILVHGYEQQTGVTSLRSFANNDACISTSFHDPLVVDGGSVLGSTTLATFDHPAEDCGVPVHGPGVWYSVVGTGATLVADTCSFATFDTRISVYTGDCDNLKCVGGNDDACGNLQSRVTWKSLLDQVYLIVVHGYREDVGFFNVSVSSEPINSDPL